MLVGQASCGTKATGTIVRSDGQLHRARAPPSSVHATVSPPSSAGRDVVGVALERRRERRGAAASSSRSSPPDGRATRAATSPATIAAAEEPSPRPCGMRLAQTTASPRGWPPSRPNAARMRLDDQVLLVGRTVARALARDLDVEARLVGDLATTEVVARPAPGRTRRSPGPRFARVAGTRTRTAWARNIGAAIGGLRPARPSTAAAASASAGTVTGAGAPAMAQSRVLEAVAGDGADDRLAGSSRPAAWRLQQAGDRGRRAGSTKTPSRAASSGRRVRISPVGDRVDQAARLVARGDRLTPRRPGCRSGSRWRWSTACATGSPVDDRRGAGRLEAPHPRRRARRCRRRRTRRSPSSRR